MKMRKTVLTVKKVLFLSLSVDHSSVRPASQDYRGFWPLNKKVDLICLRPSSAVSEWTVAWMEPRKTDPIWQLANANSNVRVRTQKTENRSCYQEKQKGLASQLLAVIFTAHLTESIRALNSQTRGSYIFALMKIRDTRFTSDVRSINGLRRCQN